MQYANLDRSPDSLPPRPGQFVDLGRLGYQPQVNRDGWNSGHIVAYQRPDGTVAASTSPVDSYGMQLQEGTLSFPVSDLSALFLNNEMVIFAAIELPENTTIVNHVWQDGPVSGMVFDQMKILQVHGVLNMVHGQLGYYDAARIHGGKVFVSCWSKGRPSLVLHSRRSSAPWLFTWDGRRCDRALSRHQVLRGSSVPFPPVHLNHSFFPWNTSEAIRFRHPTTYVSRHGSQTVAIMIFDEMSVEYIKSSVSGSPIEVAEVESTPKDIEPKPPKEFLTSLERMQPEISISRLAAKLQWFCRITGNAADYVHLLHVTRKMLFFERHGTQNKETCYND
ncbi:hypothetical protein RHSIM_Rhsim02G0096200 [Rhododendron simsii]|uniref:AIR12 DOMON domain-containing protein n=1 Tax=Rhododendron simsii TaxID=118357 RepID=A0A834H920_RHOSS|nr:hypothetical protein RHSIM_Rhsim02G0096200 [Rhododendron simsii]